jgi:TonB family protein
MLGTGGFGEVWLAERRSQFLTKKVAVKLPHDEQVDFEAIRHEAEIWEQASGHPNVLPIIDADVYEGQVVIVSEYADGGSLAERLKSIGIPSLDEAIELMIGILNGLEFLHERQIIHRDIKPQNILLQSGKPRLADFGISRAMQTTAASSTVIGTDAYMSPEAFDGKRTVQTDIWSTGVVLYQLLNGRLPFPQQHPTERMYAVLTKDFEPHSAIVSADLKHIVNIALAKLPENRFISAAAMRESLKQAKVQINHPKLAHTEDFDQIDVPYIDPFLSDDPDATAIRVQMPTEQETFVRPKAPEQSTILSLADQKRGQAAVPDRFFGSESRSNATSLSPWFQNNSLLGTLVITGLIVLGMISLAGLGSYLSSNSKISNSPAPNKATISNSLVPNNSTNFPAANANLRSANMPTGNVDSPTVNHPVDVSNKSNSAGSANTPATIDNPSDAATITQDVRIISKPLAQYTDSARAANTEGTVVLRVTFLASGKIGTVLPEKELPNGLTQQAIEASRAIKFEPAKSNGHPTTVVKLVEYNFSLY